VGLGRGVRTMALARLFKVAGELPSRPERMPAGRISRGPLDMLQSSYTEEPEAGGRCEGRVLATPLRIDLVEIFVGRDCSFPSCRPRNAVSVSQQNSANADGAVWLLSSTPGNSERRPTCLPRWSVRDLPAYPSSAPSCNYTRPRIAIDGTEVAPAIDQRVPMTHGCAIRRAVVTEPVRRAGVINSSALQTDTPAHFVVGRAGFAGDLRRNIA